MTSFLIKILAYDKYSCQHKIKKFSRIFCLLKSAGKINTLPKTEKAHSAVTLTAEYALCLNVISVIIVRIQQHGSLLLY